MSRPGEGLGGGEGKIFLHEIWCRSPRSVLLGAGLEPGRSHEGPRGAEDVRERGRGGDGDRERQARVQRRHEGRRVTTEADAHQADGTALVLAATPLLLSRARQEAPKRQGRRE